MNSSKKNENPHPSWVNFFDEHPDHQEFKEALFVELYAQFNVDAEIIISEEKVPILQATVNYDGNAENVFDNPAAIKNIYAINLILRVFAEYRGLRYLYTSLMENEKEDDRINLLSETFSELLQKIDDLDEEAEVNEYIENLNRIESNIQGRYAAFLGRYILDPLDLPLSPKRTIKYYQDCLAHTRFLSSLLDPALSLRVITNDLENKTTTTYTAHPITKKTDLQKQRIRANKNANDFEDWANLQCNPLLVQDNTQLPALCRSSHLHTLKNAFIVQAQFECNGETREWWYSRSASLAYIGDKYSKEVLEEALRENVLQLQMALKNKGVADENIDDKNVPIEILTLTTDFPVEFMDEIKVSKRTMAFVNSKNTPTTQVTYIPVNEVGTFTVGEYADGTKIPKTYGKKHSRIKLASEHAIDTVKDALHLHIHCQSGIDRTSCVDTLLNLANEKMAYDELTNLDIEHSELETKYRLGLFPPMLGHVVQSGSFGMKPNTKTGNWQGIPNLVKFLNRLNIYPTKEVFSDETNKYFYWDLAKTNRRRPINKIVLKNELEELQSDEIVKKSLQVVDKLMYDPYDEKTHFEYFDVLEDVKKAGPKYSNLLIALLIIFSIIMIAVGIICLVPSGGTSALVTSLAFIGLMLTLEYAGACAIGATALVLGAGAAAGAIGWMFYKSSQNKEITPPPQEVEEEVDALYSIEVI